MIAGIGRGHARGQRGADQRDDAATPSARDATVELDAPITRLGAIFGFQPFATNGASAGIIVWQRPMGGPIPNSPLRSFVTATDYVITVWGEGVGQTVIASRKSSEPLIANVEYTIDVTIVGKTVHARLSNGTGLKASDPKVATYAVPVACRDTYVSNPIIGAWAEFLEVWADTGRVARLLP